MKSWYKSKSVILGVLVILGGIAEYIAGLPAGVSASTISVGVLQIIIRFLTNTSLVK